MDFQINNGSVWNHAMLLLSITGILLTCLWLSSSSYSNVTDPLSLFSLHSRPNISLGIHDVGSRDELDDALARASMANNKTVFIAIINKAYADQEVDSDTTMLDIFLSSFWLGEGTWHLLDNFLLVAVDQTAYVRCKFQRLNCYKLETDGVDFTGEKVFMSGDFINMMWSRTSFLLEVLKRGYNFIFTDTDVMWLRDPFGKLSPNEGEDLQISTDAFNGDPWSTGNNINTGFYFVRSNNKTIALYEKWYGRKDSSPGWKEQDILNGILQDGSTTNQLGLTVRYLDTLFFSGFCQNSRDFKQVATVHANCCKTISAKIFDLRAVLRDWKRFRKSTDNSTDFKWSEHRACIDSWRH